MRSWIGWLGWRGLAGALALAVMMPLLGACGAGTPTSGGGAAPASEVKIVAKDDVFDPKTYTVPAGQPVKVTFVNAGKHIHEVEIKGLIAETQLQPGESRSFTVTPEKKTYTLYCEIHEDQGMVGEFTGQ
ncbi:MAG TPA: cupredoxin domain-containing protein [Thermomicrobiales bacterium]|nr:cupredoxin domain-containing protein [Thermomicrobiales bacterium]